MSRVQILLWQVTMACSGLLLFAPLTPRTSWSFGRGGGMPHSAGWDWVAPICGVIAVAALLAGGGARLEGWRAVWAFLALSAAGVAAAGHWMDLQAGRLALANSTLTPAPAVGFFATVGFAGALAALGLTACWWRRPA